jgi:hypothetical protein
MHKLKLRNHQYTLAFIVNLIPLVILLPSCVKQGKRNYSGSKSIEQDSCLSDPRLWRPLSEKCARLLRSSVSETEVRSYYYLKSARAVWMNYQTIKNDFPKLSTISNAEINSYFVINAGVISTIQALFGTKGEVNTPFLPSLRDHKSTTNLTEWKAEVSKSMTDEDGVLDSRFADVNWDSFPLPHLKAFRPLGYGRAAVVQTPFGLVDLKGIN